jgi:ATP-dependent exoDNAse (exonuclease V) beta subunit
MTNQQKKQQLENNPQGPSALLEAESQTSPLKKISYSEFKTWTECPYRHKLIYVDKLPYFSGNEYTAFGSAIHKACEEKIPDEKIDAYSIFEMAFLEELKTLKEEGHEFDKKLVNDMRSQARPICENIFPAVQAEFGNFTVVSIEEPLLEDVDDFQSYGRKFKGFIDLVIKTEDGKYHIIDWKTCSWGWNTQKKTDKIVNYQLTMYKHYFSKKHDIDPKNIETYFALLKRTAKNNNVEIFRVTSGEKKTNNCLSMLEKSVINMEKGISIKNRLSCKYCKFYKTENCT